MDEYYGWNIDSAGNGINCFLGFCQPIDRRSHIRGEGQEYSQEVLRIDYYDKDKLNPYEEDYSYLENRIRNYR